MRVTNSSAGAYATEAGEVGHGMRGTSGPPPPSCSPNLACLLGQGLSLPSVSLQLLANPTPTRPTAATQMLSPTLAPRPNCRDCRRELSQALAAACGQHGAPLQPHCSNPHRCHRVRAGVPASRCSPGQPRAGVGGIFLVRVSSRACG